MRLVSRTIHFEVGAESSPSQGVFICGTKVHCQKDQKTNQAMDLARMRWDADGPNGPDTVPNALSVLLTWWQTEGNYNQCCSGKNQAGKSKEAYWSLLSNKIKTCGIKGSEVQRRLEQKLAAWNNSIGRLLNGSGKRVSSVC